MHDNLAVRERVGARIREIRERRGLTQEQLAERAGNTPEHVGLIERGQINVTIDYLAGIARGLSVDISELFVSASHEPSSGIRPTEDEVHAIEQAAQILKRYGRGRP